MWSLQSLHWPLQTAATAWRTRQWRPLALSGSAEDAHTPLPHLPIVSAGLDLDLSHLDASQLQPGTSSVSNFVHHRRSASLAALYNSVRSAYQHICSPCGLSCASPHSPRSTLHAHNAGRAFPQRPPKLRPDWFTRCVQPCSRTGSVCALGSPGRRCLLLHMARRQEAIHHLGAIPTALGPPGVLYHIATGALCQTGTASQLTVLWTVHDPTPMPRATWV